MSIRLVIKRVDWGRRFKAIHKNTRDPRGLMRSCGAFLASRFKQAVAEQGRPPLSFLPRAVPNVMGVIQDLHEGRDPRSRRFDARPVLQDEGHLLRGIDFEVQADSVYVGVGGPAAEYATLMHGGGESESEFITRGMQERLAEFLKKTKRSAARAERKAERSGDLDDATKAVGKITLEQQADKLSFLLNERWVGQTYSVDVPPRPWSAVLPEDISDLQTLVGVKIVRPNLLSEPKTAAGDAHAPENR